MTDQLDQYPLVTEFPVAWGEMDAYGHVNNTVYFRYFENARIEYFENLDFNDPFAQEGIGPILASVSSNFRNPLTYPDTVKIGTGVTGMSESSFLMEYHLKSEKLDEIAADGECTIVTYDYEKQKTVRIPDRLRQEIENYEGESFLDKKEK